MKRGVSNSTNKHTHLDCNMLTLLNWKYYEISGLFDFDFVLDRLFLPLSRLVSSSALLLHLIDLHTKSSRFVWKAAVIFARFFLSFLFIALLVFHLLFIVDAQFSPNQWNNEQIFGRRFTQICCLLFVNREMHDILSYNLIIRLFLVKIKTPNHWTWFE